MRSNNRIFSDILGMLTDWLRLYFYYTPAIRRMVEKAYTVTPVRLSVSVSDRVRDGVSNLRLSFFRRENLCSFGHISSLFVCFLFLLLLFLLLLLFFFFFFLFFFLFFLFFFHMNWACISNASLIEYNVVSITCEYTGTVDSRYLEVQRTF